MCSDITAEPLPGTAKTGRLTLALEYPGGWGRDILDGGALGGELSGTIKRWLKDNRAQLQFIRRPGREGQAGRATSTLFIADAGPEDGATPPTLERMEIAGPEALTGVDLSTPGATPGATPVAGPLLLVCTHGKRDRCCAVKGRPLAAALAGHVADSHPDAVWESSHTKGHRFAPSMILLPWNYSFGTLDAGAATAMVDDVLVGRLPVAGNRGRGTLHTQGQVAELAVAELLAGEGEMVGLSELTVEGYRGEESDPDAPGPDSPADSRAAAADYAAVAAAVDAEDPTLRQRAGELMVQRAEMKITGRYGELKDLKRQGHFQAVSDFERAVKEAASARDVYGKYSKYNRKRHRDPKEPKRAPQLLVRRPGHAGQPGKAWLVTLESQACYPVVSSCGDSPKQGRAWVAVDVTPDHSPGA